MRFPAAASADDVLTGFEEYCAGMGIEPYPHQEEAALALAAGDHVIVTTPTGSGKSLIGLVALAAGRVRGGRVYYTAPIKALVGQKYEELLRAFGAENVGMLTGDGAHNGDAPIISCTTEILANIALRDGPEADVTCAVLDEFHFYADPQRGWAWQVPLLQLPHTQFVLASATLGDTTFFAADLERRTHRPVTTIAGTERPIPLTYTYSVDPVVEVISKLLAARQTPCYLVHFTQADAVDQAQALLAALPIRKNPARTAALSTFRFSRGFGKILSRLLRAGIGIHHAGMLPRYRRFVEHLAEQGLLDVICGTDTLGVGVNIPIRTVILTGLAKFDGERSRHLSAREFHQIAGRAGRKGFDIAGDVIVQAPEHVIVNRKALAKAGDDPKKVRKIVRKKAPPGQVNWTEATFERLRDTAPERLNSQFRITHSMVLNVLMGRAQPVSVVADLLTDNHETDQRRSDHIRQAIHIYRSLRTGGLLDRPRLSDDPNSPGYRRRGIRLLLPDDFALNQDLSPFALAAFELLDQQDPNFALDLISIIEATLEDPRPVLRALEKAARATAVAAMKAEGIEYAERMARLDDITYPQPLVELLDCAFETYASTNPWARDFELRCKSVARLMVERLMTFSEFIATFGLQRSEGVVLRYISDAYRALRSTVPAHLHNEEFHSYVQWLGAMLNSVDNTVVIAAAPRDSSGESDNSQLTDTMLRPAVAAAMFRRLELAQFERWDTLGALDERYPSNWWRTRFDEYFADHADIGIGQASRAGQYLTIRPEGTIWHITQVIDDDYGDHDWRLQATIDTEASRESGELEFLDIALVRL